MILVIVYFELKPPHPSQVIFEFEFVDSQRAQEVAKLLLIASNVVSVIITKEKKDSIGE